MINRCKRSPRGATFTVTLPRETELEDLVNWMMSISCQKFIWDRKVRSSKVTILSPEPVNLREAYAAFYAALETMGLTVEPSGDYFKIVETADAKTRTLPLYGEDRNAPSSDRFVTQIVRIKNGNTAEMSALLGKLKSKQGSIDVVGDTLIITDKGSSIRRLIRLIGELDQPFAGEKIYFYQLQYADAEEVAELVRDIFGEGSSSSKSKTKSSDSKFNNVIVDDRSNTLIIVADASDYATIRRLIKKLDVKLPGGAGRMHVKRLRNADAKEVAQVLSTLAGAAASGGNDKKRNSTAANPSANLFSGEVKITPDPATRSLVIIASQKDFENLEPIIDQLDAERTQLYIEVYLLEVTMGRNLEAGAGAHGGYAFGANGDTVGVISSAPTAEVSSLLLSPSTLTSGLGGALIGPREIPSQALGTTQNAPVYGLVIQALQTNADVNIVSEPHIYAADNQEAEIEVGRNVPTPGALSFSAGGSGQSLVPLQSVERQDVTLRIKVKPYVNDENTVTLDVEVEDRDIAERDEVLGVTTTKRRLKLDKIVGRDDHPVVLGGLIREREVETVNQVPGLGSIPLLGWLFKRKVKTKEKVNFLMVMIPHILKSPDDVRRIHERRDRERREFIERNTNFKAHDLPAHVNWSRKAGLLSSIDRAGRLVEEESQRIQAADEEMRTEAITGELGMSPRREEQNSASTIKVSPKKATRKK